MKIVKEIFIIIISIIITILFEKLSWYHLGDVPTKTVLIRLIFFMIVLVLLINGILILLSRLKNQ